MLTTFFLTATAAITGIKKTIIDIVYWKIFNRALALLIVLAGTVFCWGPYIYVAFTNSFGDPNSVPMSFQIYAPAFAKTQASLDAFIYVFSNKKFR